MIGMKEIKFYLIPEIFNPGSNKINGKPTASILRLSPMEGLKILASPPAQ